MTLVNVSIYQTDGSTLVAAIPRRQNTTWTDELNTPGVGSFDIHLDDPVFTSHPTLLAAGNVVVLTDPTSGAELFRWRIEAQTPVTIGPGEKGSRFTTVSGRGMAGALQSAVVAPILLDQATQSEVRGFNFASPDALATWTDATTWVTPRGVRQDMETTARRGYPKPWHDPAAQWLWSADPESNVPIGRNWFRGTFHLTADIEVQIESSGDNFFEVWLDGEIISISDQSNPYGFRQNYLFSKTLAAGDHLLAAWVDNALGPSHGPNPAGFLATIGAFNNATGKLVSVLTHTDTSSAWLVRGYGNPPGWTIGGILAKVIGEAQARGVTPLQHVTLGFSRTVDSYGIPWPSTLDQSTALTIGDDLLKIVDEATEIVADVWFSGNVFNAAPARGTDRTSTVVYADGDNVLASTPTFSSNGLANAALVRYSVYWTWVLDTVSIAANGRYETYLSLADVDDLTQATKMAIASFTETNTPAITIPLTVSSAKGPQPYRDYHVGDLITGPGLFGIAASLRVMSITATELEGYISYDLDCYPT